MKKNNNNCNDDMYLKMKKENIQTRTLTKYSEKTDTLNMTALPFSTFPFTNLLLI
jgi:hypothetical protein